MGNGVSAGVAAGIEGVSASELQGVLNTVPADTKSKLLAALDADTPQAGLMSTSNKKTLTVLEDLISAVHEAEQDRKFSEAAGLAPARQQRARASGRHTEPTA